MAATPQPAVLLHGPPIGPIGLVFFAAAVVLLARSRRARVNSG